MRRLPLIAVLVLAACGPKSGSKTPKDNFDADARSGPDQKRSTAQKIDLNKPHTYYIRVTAPARTDGTVYTMEAQWQEPTAVAVTTPPPREEPLPPPNES